MWIPKLFVPASLLLLVSSGCGRPSQQSAPAAAPEAASSAAAPGSAVGASPDSAPTAATPTAELDLEKLRASEHALRSNRQPPGKSERYGHSEVLIHATMDRVREQMTDYAHYKDLVPEKFHNARVLGKEKDHTELYLQVPILHGLVTLWEVLRFGPVKVVGQGIEIVEGKHVRGNVKDGNLVLTAHRIADGESVLECDLLILPKVPAPQSAIDEELRDAAGQALDAIRERAERASVTASAETAAK
jgi:hypothetical protein